MPACGYEFYFLLFNWNIFLRQMAGVNCFYICARFARYLDDNKGNKL